MAKDPAFLFYPGDFNTGTQFFTDEQVGKYMRLLMAQHQHGHLSEEQVIFICKSYDKHIMNKFKKDSAGLWFNERLEIEVNKRKNFVLSRSKNKEGKTKPKNTSKSYDSHMENRDENEIIDENIKGAETDFHKPDVNGDTIFFPIDNPTIRDAWARWKEYRLKQHGKKYPIMGEQAAIKQIEGMTEEQILNTIFKAIESNWLNLYPDRNGNTNGKKRGFDVDAAKDSISDYLAKHG